MKEKSKLEQMAHTLHAVDIYEISLLQTKNKMLESSISNSKIAFEIWDSIRISQENKILGAKYAYNQILKTLLPI